MTRWTPDVGELFFAECLKTLAVPSREGDATATVRFLPNKSYADEILRLVAMDDRVLVADSVYGPFKGVRLMLLRADFVFKPVGPAVAEALGLDVAP